MLKNKLYTAIILCLLLTACSGARKDAGGKPVVAVSIEPQRYLLESIVGDRMDVVTVMGKGADPENYDPSMSVLRKVEGSRLYFKVGAGAFEDALIGRLSDAGQGIDVVDTTEGIDFIGVEDGCDEPHGHAHGHSHGAHEFYDPHTWSSLTNARIMAANMLAAVQRIDPEGTEYYKSRYDSLVARLDSVDAELRDVLKPVSGRSFMVWHPSLSYFARDYGLRQIAVGEESKELSAASLREKIDMARASGTQVLFIQPEYDGGRSELLARQTGTRGVTVNLLSYEWTDEMIKMARELASN